MPKWSKDAKEFSVKVQCFGDRGCNCQIPKPIMDMLGNPEKVSFVIKGTKIEFQVPKVNSP